MLCYVMRYSLLNCARSVGPYSATLLPIGRLLRVSALSYLLARLFRGCSETRQAVWQNCHGCVNEDRA